MKLRGIFSPRFLRSPQGIPPPGRPATPAPFHPAPGRDARAVFAVLLGLVAFASRAPAQTALFVKHGDKMLLVRGASGVRPLVEANGKLIPVSDQQFALAKVKEYLPFFVSVRDIDVRTTYLDVQGSAINNDFHFNATFETAYRLDNVFIVLELDTSSAGKELFLHAIGPLEPGRPLPVSLVVPLTSALGPGEYLYHVYAGGGEVLHSGIPFMAQEAALEHMVARRIAGVRDAPLRLFVGPNPEYPRALLKAKVTGQAAIALLVDAEGKVIDPVVRSATDPAFGEAALAAVRLWRFLPRVQGGHPVETRVEVPFDFKPPP